MELGHYGNKISDFQKEVENPVLGNAVACSHHLFIAVEFRKSWGMGGREEGLERGGILDILPVLLLQAT